MARSPLPPDQRSTPISVTLAPASVRVVERARQVGFATTSAAVNAALRAFAEGRAWHDLLGTSPPESPLLAPSPLSSVSLSLVVDGRERPILAHGGDYFAAAEPGKPYAIRLRNLTSRRVEVVLSVDGVSAVDGLDASFASRGWVLASRATADILGWYRSTSEVAAFTFAAAGSGESYAEQTGRGTDNVGTVGVAVFHERERQRAVPCGTPRTKAILRSTGDFTRTSGGLDLDGLRCSIVGAPSRPSDSATAYGAATEMRSGLTTFERATATPVETLTVRYATVEVLRSWGVPVGNSAGAANPWPGNAGCPAPAGWSR